MAPRSVCPRGGLPFHGHSRLCEDLIEQLIAENALWVESLPRLVELGQRKAGLETPLPNGWGGVREKRSTASRAGGSKLER